ncbi:MAG: hypothetical protein V7K14_18390 [Nostoc sp.]|uniref:hypothetical protein n=1 Tax=Nostoc sp. TaxID=1180 RepID=UPI002FF78140
MVFGFAWIDRGVRSLELGVWRDAINRVCTGVWSRGTSNAQCPMPNTSASLSTSAP